MCDFAWKPDSLQLSSLIQLIKSGGAVEYEDIDLLHLAYLSFAHQTVEEDVKIRAGRHLNAQLSTVFARAASSLEADSISYIKIRLLHSLRSELSFELQHLYAQIASTLLSEQNSRDMTDIWPEVFSLLLQMLQQDSTAPTAYIVLREIIGHGQNFSRSSGKALLNECVSLCLPHLLSPALNSFAFHLLYDITLDCPEIFKQRSAEILHAIDISMKGNNEMDSNRLSMLMNRWWDRYSELMKPHMSLMIEAMIKYSLSAAPVPPPCSSPTPTKDCSHCAHEVTCHWPELLLSVAQNRDLAPYLPRLVTLILQNLSYDDNETSPRRASEADAHREKKVRKRFVNSLQTLASAYPEAILDFLFPLLELRFTSSRWRDRESAAVALGAICLSCRQELKAAHTSLIPTVIAMLKDPQPLLRASACWTVGSLSFWLRDMDIPSALFTSAVQALISCQTDESEKVKIAAVVALQQLCCFPPTPQALLSISGPLLQYLSLSFETMGDDLLLTCAADLGMIALRPGPADPVVSLSIMKRLETVPKENTALRGNLLEILTSLAESAKEKEQFSSTAKASFPLYLRFVEDSEASSNEALEIALDLLGRITAAFSFEYVPRLGQEHIPRLLLRCTQSPDEKVSTEAYFLVRLIASRDRSLTPLLSILPALIQDLVSLITERPFISREATYTLGKLVRSPSVDIRPHVPSLVSSLIPNLPPMTPDRSLCLLFYLSMRYPEAFAPSVDRYLSIWCDAARSVRSATDSRRAKTLRSICSLYDYNPVALEKELERQRTRQGDERFVTAMARLLEERKEYLEGKRTS